MPLNAVENIHTPPPPPPSTPPPIVMTGLSQQQQVCTCVPMYYVPMYMLQWLLDMANQALTGGLVRPSSQQMQVALLEFVQRVIAALPTDNTIITAGTMAETIQIVNNEFLDDNSENVI